MDAAGFVGACEDLEGEVGAKRAEDILRAVLDVIQAARAAEPRENLSGYVRIVVNARGALVKVYRSIEIEQRGRA